MGRYILRYRGTEPVVDGDVRRIRAAHGVDVVDGSVPTMFLVEGSEEDVRALSRSLADWLLVPEVVVVRSEPRPRPKRAPR